MPQDYSQYQITGNKAIDIVAQAIGHAKANKMSVKRVLLSPVYYAIFWAGYEVLAKDFLPKDVQLTFDGYDVVSGGRAMFESIKVEYNIRKPENEKS